MKRFLLILLGASLLWGCGSNPLGDGEDDSVTIQNANTQSQNTVGSEDQDDFQEECSIKCRVDCTDDGQFSYDREFICFTSTEALDSNVVSAESALPDECKPPVREIPDCNGSEEEA